MQVNNVLNVINACKKIEKAKLTYSKAVAELQNQETEYAKSRLAEENNKTNLVPVLSVQDLEYSRKENFGFLKFK